MTKPRRANCIRFVRVGEGAELAAADAKLSLAGFADALMAPQSTLSERLRALSHDNLVFIGLAIGDKPSSVAVCPQHQIIMRGPTLIFPLDHTRANGHGCLADIVNQPHEPKSLEVMEAVIYNGESGSELRLWPFGEAAFPSLNAVDRDQAKGLTEFLQEMLGKPIRLGDGPAAVIGDSPFETYAIGNMKQNDAPPDHIRLLELPAYATSLAEHYPYPASIVLSVLSFYLTELGRAVEDRCLSEEEATKRINELTGIIEKLPDTKRSSQEWPLTADQWEEPE